MSLQVSNCESLVGAIADVHQRLQSEAAKAVNTALTLRNWLIGLYIHEYELAGQDRATYGERLIERLSDRLKARGVPRTDGRELRRYRLFYLTYPQIRESLPPEFVQTFPDTQMDIDIRDVLTPKSLIMKTTAINYLVFYRAYPRWCGQCRHYFVSCVRVCQCDGVAARPL
jgi:hypothetical protein